MNDITKSLTDFFYKIFPNITELFSDEYSGIMFSLFILAAIIFPFCIRKSYFIKGKPPRHLCAKTDFLTYTKPARILMLFHFLIFLLFFLFTFFILCLPIFKMELQINEKANFALLDYYESVLFNGELIEYSTGIERLIYLVQMFAYPTIVPVLISYYIYEIIASVFGFFFPKKVLKNYYDLYEQKGELKTPAPAISVVFLIFIPVFLYLLLYVGTNNSSIPSLSVLANPLTYVVGLTEWMFIPCLFSVLYLLFCLFSKLIMIKFVHILDGRY